MSSSLYSHVSRRVTDAELAWTGSADGFSVAPVPEDEYLRRLGAVIRETRKLRRMSQDELGAKVGRDNNTISRWERGATSLSAYDLSQLWVALEIPAEWLLEPTDSISEMGRRIAQLRRAAAEAARDDEGEGPAPPADA